jgi:outer membrane protein assembly factor BamB
VVTRDDTLLCFSLNTGEVAWSFFTGWERDYDIEYANPVDVPPIVSSPVVVDGKVLIVGRDSTIYSLGNQSGTVLWSRPLGAARTSNLTLFEDRLILGLSDYHLVSVDVATGEIVGEDTLDYLAYGGMALAGHNLYFLAAYEDLQPEEVVALDLGSKEHLWTTSTRYVHQDSFWYVPRVHVRDTEVIVGSTKGKVVGYEGSSGRPTWQTTLDGRIRGIGHSDSLVYVGTFEGVLYALRVHR